MSYADVNGISLYYEEHGSGRPLVLLHGGLGAGEMLAPILPRLAEGRRVIAADLQAHGHTADIDRPLALESMADDIAGLIRHLGLDRADVMGYSLGGGVAARTAIQHPELVGRLVVTSTPVRRAAWYPEVLVSMDQMGAQAAEMLTRSPMYELYSKIAPRVEDFPRLLAKMGDLLRRDYDWTAEVAALAMPVLVVAGDADSFPPSHAAEFYGLLGGGQRDAGWQGLDRSPSRLAILPGATHYDIFTRPDLAEAAVAFLDADISQP